MRRPALLAGGLVAGLLAGPAPAAPLEADLRLVPALDAVPVLGAFLRDEAAAIEAQAAAEAGEDPGTAAHRLTLTDRVTFSGPRFTSVLRTVTQAAPAPAFEAREGLVWDRQAEGFVRLGTFLADGAAGRAALIAIAEDLRATLVSGVHGGDPGGFANRVVLASQPDVTVLRNFTLLPSTEAGRIGGIALHFATGEIAAAERGAVSIAIPQQVFATGLNPALAPLFAGAPAR